MWAYIGVNLQANLQIHSKLSSDHGAVVSPPYPQPGPFIFTVRVKHISSNPCRSCSGLFCVPYHQIIKFQRSLTGLARWGLVKSIEGSSRGLDLSLSQLILCCVFLLGSWVSPYHRPALPWHSARSRVTSERCLHGRKTQLKDEKCRMNGNAKHNLL